MKIPARILKAIDRDTVVDQSGKIDHKKSIEANADTMSSHNYWQRDQVETMQLALIPAAIGAVATGLFYAASPVFGDVPFQLLRIGTAGFGALSGLSGLSALFSAGVEAKDRFDERMHASFLGADIATKPAP